jgi:hypothetical protein
MSYQCLSETILPRSMGALATKTIYKINILMHSKSFELKSKLKAIREIYFIFFNGSKNG